MTFKQLVLIMKDCSMDEICTESKVEEKYKQAYKNYIFMDLYYFVKKHTLTDESASLEEYCEVISKYVEKMDLYSRYNPKTKEVFIFAKDFAQNIEDVLTAML